MLWQCKFVSKCVSWPFSAQLGVFDSQLGVSDSHPQASVLLVNLWLNF